MTDVPITFCTNCGAHLEPDAHFCGACGHGRGGESIAVAAPPADVSPGDVPPGLVTVPTPAVPGPVPPPVVPPPAPPPMVPPIPPRRPPGRPMLIVAGIIASIALIAALAVIVVVTRPDGGTTLDELVLEPLAYRTAEPFTPAVTAAPETPPPAGAVRVAASGQTPGGQQVPGAQSGLYGGTKNNATCDADQLVAYLQGNADKAQAWAGVLGIGPGDIAGYVRGLTAILLTRDTRVTNHGFAGGRATTVLAVLQAGTAVMVDRFGVPRVKCGCGNPLTEPGPVTGTTRVTGTPWTGFTIATTVVVTVTVPVTTFVLVDVVTGLVFVRPPGSAGRDDVEPSRDDRCRALPSEPDCQAPATTSTIPTSSTTATTATTSTTSTTAPPITSPPPTEPPPTPVPTAPPGDEPGDAGGTAIGAVQDIVSRCGQGGSLGQFSAIEVRAFVFRVSVTVTFEGSDVPGTATWLVDLTSGHAQVVPEDPAASALTCLGD